MIGICYFVLYKLMSFISDRNYYIISNTFDAQCEHQCYHTNLPASGAAGPRSEGEQSSGSPRGQKTHDARVAAGIPDETIRTAIHPSRGRDGWHGAEHDTQEG